MLLKLLEINYMVDAVVFYDTGMEYQAIYNNRDRIKEILEERQIEFVELKPKNSFLYQMLVRPVKDGCKYGYEWCGGTTRWGTADKTDAIKKYFRVAYPNEEIYEYVGIASDEIQRVKDDPHKLYPLVDWNMTEKDCLEYCYSKGFDWNEDGVELYEILDRVSCWCCQNKNLKELKNIYKYLPKYWLKLKGIQSKIDRPMKQYGSVFELEERFKKEIEEERKQVTMEEWEMKQKKLNLR